jgi:hypothetical protein
MLSVKRTSVNSDLGASKDVELFGKSLTTTANITCQRFRGHHEA